MSSSSSYWNREQSPRFHTTAAAFDEQQQQQQQQQQQAAVTKTAKIISLSSPEDDANRELANLPKGAEIVAMGSSMDDFDVDSLRQSGANVIFVAHPKARQPLGALLEALPGIEWVHARSAGIDFITSSELTAAEHVVCTNAKGQFSSTLAEYTMMACSYFAKDLPKLMKQKEGKIWGKYNVKELRGA